MAPFLHYRRTNAQPCVVEVDRGELLELRGVSGPLKRRGRAGEIRTRGLLVPNQALCRAKLPPAQGQLTPHSLTLSPMGRRKVFKQTGARARRRRASP